MRVGIAHDTVTAPLPAFTARSFTGRSGALVFTMPLA